MKNRKRLLALFFVLLSGCSNKPPACGDSESINAVKNLITTEVRKNLDQFKVYMFVDKEDYSPLDPSDVDDLMATMKLELSMITSDGYDENAKAHSCHGRLSMEMVGKEAAADIDYVLQATEDQPDDFLVQIAAGKEIIGHLSNLAFYHLKSIHHQK